MLGKECFMKLLSFKKDGNKAVAHLLLDIKEFEKAVDTVWKRQRRWFNIPGFRKGKVPRGIIENEYGVLEIIPCWKWLILQ